MAVVGQGGMGTVYRGHDRKLDRDVAVKTVRHDRLQDPEARARFRREARTLSRLNHPAVCQVFDLVERPEADYLVLEWVQGETLGTWLESQPPPAARLATGRRIAEALAAAHERGVVHRDLKPDNVMVAPDGSVKVLDFGLARSQDAGPEVHPEQEGTSAPEAPFRTTVGSVMGTLPYMSPEQARGEPAGPATDLFALGAVLQEVLASEPIHPALPRDQLLERVRRGETRLAAGLAGEAAGLIRALLSAEPEARPTAEEVVRRLAALEAAPLRRRRRILFGSVAALALGLAIASAGISWRMARPAPLLADGARARVAILPIENASGDPADNWVRDGLGALVARQLDHLGEVDLVSAKEVAEVLEASARTPDGQELPLDRWAAQLRVDIVIQARMSRRDGRVVLEYRPGRPTGGPGPWRSLVANGPAEVADLLGRQLALRLSPSTAPVELRDRLSIDPFLNQAYAMGVDRLRSAGGRSAETYFRVCLDRDPGFAWARVQLAASLSASGRFADAEAEARQAEAAAQSSGDRSLRSEARRQRAFAMQHQGMNREAEALVRTAVAELRQHQDLGKLAVALHQLGQIAWERGGAKDLAAAERLHQESLGLARAERDRFGIARSLRALGMVADSRWDLVNAADRFREALAVLEGAEAPGLRATILNSLGITLHYAGQLEPAEAALREALDLNRRIGNPAGEIANLVNLGDLRLRRQDWRGATAALEEALPLAERIGSPRSQALASLNLAEALARSGRLDEAERRLEVAARLGASEWHVRFIRGLLAQSRSDLAAAQTHLRNAKRLAGKEWEARHAQALDAVLAADPRR